jgi:NitT/TauT family transport system permease protein
MKSSSLIGVLWRYTPLFLIFVIWEVGTQTGLISRWALPTFSSVVAAWATLMQGGELLYHAAASLMRGFAGLGLAIVIGTVLGVLMAWVKPIRVIFNPIVQIFYPMPKSALIPIMILWLGLGHASKIVLIFLGCMLPVTISAFNGARGVEPVLIWSARSLGATRSEVLREIILPAAMPEILAGIRTALALSFVLLVSSELVIAREGLGYLIGWLGDGGVYPGMFAVVLTVAGLGFVADRLYLAFMTRRLAWRE